MNNKNPDAPERFNELSPDEQSQLLSWIDQNIESRKTFNDRSTSYGLKHRFESTGGFYVVNGAFKGAMLEAGYFVKNSNDLNWIFNISSRSKCFKN